MNGIVLEPKSLRPDIIQRIETMDDVLAADVEARRIAREEVNRLSSKNVTVAVH